MNHDYLYAMIDVMGVCWVIRDGGTEKVHGLPTLLGDGWRPVRETPFVSGGAYILILLERERGRG